MNLNEIICFIADTALVTKNVNLSRIKVNFFISPDTLNLTAPTTALTTTTREKSVLVISITVPVGILLVIIPVSIYVLLKYWKRKRKKSSQVGLVIDLQSTDFQDVLEMAVSKQF